MNEYKNLESKMTIRQGKKRILTKNVFDLPEEIFHVINGYEPIALPIFLMFSKMKMDGFVKMMKDDEHRYETLLSWTKKIHNNNFHDLQHNNDLDEAFYNYFTRIKESLILPKNIADHIENNKKNIKSAGNISNRIMSKIQKVCLHKNTREHKQFVYDECIESTYYCEFCNFEVRE